MTTFLDGPAKGWHLNLSRFPKFLRVTELCSFGNDAFDETVWDALDQIDDVPRDGERLHAYQLAGEPTRAFVDYRGPRRRESGLVVIASYRLCLAQPDDATMRCRSRWRVWCENEYRNLKATS